MAALTLPAAAPLPHAQCGARLRLPAPCANARARAPLLRLGSCQAALSAALSPPAVRRRRLRCVVAAAAPKRAEPNKTTRVVPRRKGAPAKGPEPDGPRWNFFALEPYLYRWEVPWGAPTVVAGLAGWGVSFFLTGVVVVPLLAAMEGISLRDLATAQKTDYILVLQTLETVVGFAVIWACVRKYQPLPPDLFRIDGSKPFSPENGWLVWGLLGYGAAFVAIAAAAGAASLFENGVTPSGNGTVDVIAPLLTSDALSFATLLTVTSVLAPALEETVFRGFLLTSLTKWMPAPAAVLASSVIFAAVHLAPKDFPQLLGLGLVLGFSYVRTRNLLTPLLVHSLWNTGVLTVLTVLSAQGADMQELLR